MQVVGIVLKLFMMCVSLVNRVDITYHAVMPRACYC